MPPSFGRPLIWWVIGGRLTKNTPASTQSFSAFLQVWPVIPLSDLITNELAFPLVFHHQLVINMRHFVAIVIAKPYGTYPY